MLSNAQKHCNEQRRKMLVAAALQYRNSNVTEFSKDMSHKLTSQTIPEKSSWEFDAVISSINLCSANVQNGQPHKVATAIRLELTDDRIATQHLDFLQALDPLEKEFLKNKKVKLKLIIED